MEWKEYKLGDLLAPKGYIRGPFGSALKRTELKESGIPVYEQQHAIYNSRSFRYFIDEVKYAEMKRFVVQTNDLIISCSGTVGEVSLINESDEKGIISQALLLLRCNNLLISPRYLYYFFKTTKGHNSIIERSSGSVQTNISKRNVIEQIPLLLPSISNQDKIVSILSSLDRKIELNNKINAQLEEMAQAIFKSWFVDFEPFKDGNFIESELGMIPEGWRVGNIYEHISVIYGAPYKSALFNENKEGLPLIRIRDLKDCAPQFYTPEILPQTEYVNIGDIVAGMDAEFVPYIWKGSKGVLNQRVCKFKPVIDSFNNLYVLYQVKPLLEYVQSYKTGTTVSHLGKADIDKFVIVLPPKDIVAKCSALLTPILNQITNLSEQSSRLSSLRDTLLPKLMSGEIEVEG